MTVWDRFYRTVPAVATPGEIAKEAGRLIGMCHAADRPFDGTVQSVRWRCRVGPVLEHREMVAEDLGLEGG